MKVNKLREILRYLPATLTVKVFDFGAGSFVDVEVNEQPEGHMLLIEPIKEPADDSSLD